MIDEFDESVVHAFKARDLREEAAALANQADILLQAADFHEAASRNFMRDWSERPAEGGNPPTAPVHRDRGSGRRGEGGAL